MKPISGFEQYSINEAGAVLNNKSGKFLKPSLNENGYLYASLWCENRAYPRTVHRLVALTYIPNPENKPFVNHLDANRSNPHRDNLEWCTQSENIKHAYNIGNMSQKKNFTPTELDWLLAEVLAGRNMTDLATQMNVGLSRLTINLRKRVYETSQSDAYEAMLREQKRIRNTEANTNKRRPVTQLDRLGKAIATFPSLQAAAHALGKATSGPISNALNPHNAQKIGYGYQWKFT
jgi:NUMOD4 motif/HNH endonuclease